MGKGEHAVVVAVYVDDMTIAGKEEKVLEIKRKIAEEWQITVPGRHNICVGTRCGAGTKSSTAITEVLHQTGSC